MPPSIETTGDGGGIAKGDASEKNHGTTPSTRRAEDDEAKPYVLAGELGKGSFATVYKGFHEVSCTGEPSKYYQPIRCVSSGHTCSSSNQDCEQEHIETQVVRQLAKRDPDNAATITPAHHKTHRHCCESHKSCIGLVAI